MHEQALAPPHARNASATCSSSCRLKGRRRTCEPDYTQAKGRCPRSILRCHLNDVRVLEHSVRGASIAARAEVGVEELKVFGVGFRWLWPALLCFALFRPSAVEHKKHLHQGLELKTYKIKDMCVHPVQLHEVRSLDHLIEGFRSIATLQGNEVPNLGFCSKPPTTKNTGQGGTTTSSCKQSQQKTENHVR